jgi:hypothetical protein
MKIGNLILAEYLADTTINRIGKINKQIQGKQVRNHMEEALRIIFGIK